MKKLKRENRFVNKKIYDSFAVAVKKIRSAVETADL